jgi:hypothetical protein
MHNHYASTDIDPACDLCALATAFRPIEIAPTSGRLDWGTYETDEEANEAAEEMLFWTR